MGRERPQAVGHDPAWQNAVYGRVTSSADTEVEPGVSTPTGVAAMAVWMPGVGGGADGDTARVAAAARAGAADAGSAGVLAAATAAAAASASVVAAHPTCVGAACGPASHEWPWAGGAARPPTT